VVDNLSSGRTENIKRHVEAGKVEFQNENLADTGAISLAMAGMKIAFHLATAHVSGVISEIHGCHLPPTRRWNVWRRYMTLRLMVSLR
jgi:hypothetical protein